MPLTRKVRPRNWTKFKPQTTSKTRKPKLNSKESFSKKPNRGSKNNTCSKSNSRD